MTEYLLYDPKPGMLVRCLRNFSHPRGCYGDELLPRKNVIYTIAKVERCAVTGSICITLVELPNQERPYFNYGVATPHEPAFGAAGFVPVDPKRLDVFRQAKVDA